MDTKKMGGVRPGAGRPKVENKRVTLSTRVKPEIFAWIKSQEGSKGSVIERLCKEKMNVQGDLFDSDSD